MTWPSSTSLVSLSPSPCAFSSLLSLSRALVLPLPLHATLNNHHHLCNFPYSSHPDSRITTFSCRRRPTSKPSPCVSYSTSPTPCTFPLWLHVLPPRLRR